MNIDWTDERAIGLKCWFARGSEISTLGEFKGVFKKISERFPATPFIRYDCHNNIKGYYDKCRLAQGEKTLYDGSGQPVPDGVDIKQWFCSDDRSSLDVMKSQNVEWSTVHHYQVQEMPEEKHPLQDLTNNQQDLPAEFAKALNDNIEDLYDTSKPSKQAKSTVPIKQSTINEIVECLKNAKSATNELIDDEVIPASGGNPVVDALQKEIATINKLINELRGK